MVYQNYVLAFCFDLRYESGKKLNDIIIYNSLQGIFSQLRLALSLGHLIKDDSTETWHAMLGLSSVKFVLTKLVAYLQSVYQQLLCLN